MASLERVRKKTLNWNIMAKTKRNNRKMYILALLIVTAGLVAYFASRPTSLPTDYSSTEALDIPFTKGGELLFIGQTSGDTLATIDIEVANDNQTRARGLMYRTLLPENGGMLFIHDREEVQSYWMKNTYISLDMLFIDSNLEIATIHANTSPMREWSYASTQPVLYVLEVNAGFCNRHNIQTGDRVHYTLAD